MTSPTTPSDDITGLSKRLRDMHPNMQQIMDIDILLEAATQLDALSARVKDCEEVLADKRRLAREIDIALHGEEGAAKQASLCDLVEPARRLRVRVQELEADMEYQARAHSKLVNELEEDRVSGWNRCREAESQRDAAKAAADTLRQERDEALGRLKIEQSKESYHCN